jgi:hypothetical protein
MLSVTRRRPGGAVCDDVRMEEVGQLHVALHLLNVDGLHQQVGGILQSIQSISFGRNICGCYFRSTSTSEILRRKCGKELLVAFSIH